MNKTITVTLNGQIFTLEEEAFDILQVYLDGIKKHFSKNEDKDEIIKDIEASIAEKFIEKISSKKQVVTKTDVEKIISILGEAEEIIEEDKKFQDDLKEETNSQEKNNTIKRLYRDVDDVVIAGVCSGIAAYFGIDPVFVRLIFALSIFFGGFGIIAYIILWIVVPEAKTGVQKLQMQGAEVTLKKIEEVAKEKSAEIRKKVKKEGWANVLLTPINFVSEILRAIINFFRHLFPVLGSIIGFLISMIMILSIVAYSIFSALLIVGKDSGFIRSDVPLDQIISNPSYYLAVISLFLLVVIPLFSILMLGAAMLRRKNVFSFVSSSVMVGLWMVSLVVFSAIAIDVSPRIEDAMKNWQDVEISQMNIDLDNFDRIYISDNFRAEIREAKDFSIIAKGREVDLERLAYEIDRGQLQLYREEDSGICLACFDNSIDFEISAPHINEIVANNTSEVVVYGFNPDTMRIKLNNSSKADVLTNASRVESEVNGASWLSLDGSSKNVEIELSGVSKLNIGDMNLDVLRLDLDGASRAELVGYAENVDLSASGSSKIFAFTMPMKFVSVDASGASKIELDVREKLYTSSSEAASIKYRGSADLEIVNDGETVNIEPMYFNVINGDELDENAKINIETY
ncbi:hypothetical protein C0583_00745 [Candidatus Parcubacteria bacterium]|nr:MAG: hypothetical protein C0583_00745 [Candidatus Parcubacteria bacterium]